MQKTTFKKSLQSKLWLALLVSAVGLSACSNEVEETPDNTIDTTEAAPVETGPTGTEIGDDTAVGETIPMDETTTDTGMVSTDSPIDPAGTGTATTGTMSDETMTDGAMTDGMADGTVMEDTANPDQTPTDSVQ